MKNINVSDTAKNKIKKIINKKRGMIRLSLSACVHCSICSDSCFLFRLHKNDPTYTPSYKAIHSIGRIYKKKGRLSDEEYEDIKSIIWDKCVLCTRCYCPIGISIPSLISTARTICREKGFYRTYNGNEDSR